MRTSLVPALLVMASCYGCAAAGRNEAAHTPQTGVEAAARTGTSAAPEEPAAVASAEKKAEENAPEEKAAVARDADSGLEGDRIGDAFGAGGLGLSGTGKGGGGTGEGTIGLGSIGTLGHGAGTGTGQGYGRGAGSAGGKSGSRGKVAAATATTTGGGLPPEVIQRIVRQHMGAIQLCYEAALTKAPALGGKVAVSFTINAQGAVAAASVGDTNISDAQMVTCVISAVRRMSFPAPESGGVVNVTYPFAFSTDQ